MPLSAAGSYEARAATCSAVTSVPSWLRSGFSSSTFRLYGSHADSVEPEDLITRVPETMATNSSGARGRLEVWWEAGAASLA